MPTDLNVPHRVWWWIHDPNDPVPVPYQATYDTGLEAEAAARKFVQERNDPYERLRWIKVFRAGNEAYEIYRWENPNSVIEEKKFEFVEERPPKKKRWWRRK